jgi:hypothetical protein
MTRLWLWIKNNPAFLIYLALGFFVRFWNYRNFLFFTWDQGRDAFVLERIAHGDPVLVGPTSGLPGFFLGPLWYYAGLPGYVLTGGNPYGISLWYIFLASLALPLFWVISHKLFPARRLAIVSAYLLAFLPGSISGSTMIWNPLITLPLMSAALLAFWKGRGNRWWLWLGFFLLALNLQAEFAYAIFFIIPLFLLIPWIRRRFDPVDFAGAAAAMGLTLWPQLAFELRNNWIMTRSLLKALADPERTASWLHLINNRPGELYWTTMSLILGGFGKQGRLLTPIVVVITLLGLKAVWDQRKSASTLSFGWKLLAVFAILPYPFFLVWRGNYGNFFVYYLTAHFIFLAPLLLLGLTELARNYLPAAVKKLYPGRDWSIFILGILFAASVMHASAYLFENKNQAGLQSMDRAVSQVFGWSSQDQIAQPFVRIFTPNGQTEQYDYLFHWKARQLRRPVPMTVRAGGEGKWYLLMEPDYQIPEKRFVPWYRESTASGYLWRKEQVGVLTLETWSKEPLPTTSGQLK